jgi:hypothetical protein
VPGPQLRGLLGRSLDRPGVHRRLALRVVLDALHELGTGVLGGQPGDPLERRPLLVLDRGEPLEPRAEGPALVVETLLPLGDPVLPAFDVAPLLLQVQLHVPPGVLVRFRPGVPPVAPGGLPMTGPGRAAAAAQHDGDPGQHHEAREQRDQHQLRGPDGDHLPG